MSNRSIPFDKDAVCESCGKKGAFDFMGDELCGECAFTAEKSQIPTDLKSDCIGLSDRKLGDGEPSPPPAKQPRTFIGVRNHRETVLASLLEELVVIKQVNACCFKVWFGGVFCGVEGSEVAANNKGNVMTNSILRKLRSGAAQEVSPPSPDKEEK